MPISEDIREAAASVNFKVGIELPTNYSTLHYGETVAHLQAMNKHREYFSGALAKTMVEPDPTEAVADRAILTGNDFATQMVQALMAAVGSLSAGQQLSKQGNNAPPETGK